MNTVKIVGHGYCCEFSSWWDAWAFVRSIWWQVKLDNVTDVMFEPLAGRDQVTTW